MYYGLTSTKQILHHFHFYRYQRSQLVNQSFVNARQEKSENIPPSEESLECSSLNEEIFSRSDITDGVAASLLTSPGAAIIVNKHSVSSWITEV